MSFPVPLLLAATWVDQFIGLRHLSIFSENIRLGFVHELPPWAWAAIIALAIVISGWSYHRLYGSRLARNLLAASRSTLLIFLAALIAGPQLIQRQDLIERDELIMLVDRSASMAVRDAQSPLAPQQVLTRDQLLQAAVKQNESLFDASKLGQDRHIDWVGFDSGIFRLDPLYQAAPPAPQGQSTQLASAMEQALQRASGRPISAVVLMTDGRSAQPTGADLTRRLKQLGVRVFPVPLGAQVPGPDLAVAQVDFPRKAFISDIVPVTVQLEQRPADAAMDLSKVTVKLVDLATGRVLDQRSPQPGATLKDPIRLSTRSTLAGVARWSVQVQYEGAQPELVTENNSRDVSLELVDKQIRVLYVEGYPRWEYRYLKNMVVREKAMLSSMMLVSADRAFAQEGDAPITRLPRDAQELEPYDVIIIGDVPAEYLGAELMQLIRDHVASRAAAVLWIGGEQATPRSYEGTPLADLLPMRRPGAVKRIELPGQQPLAVEPSPAAEQLGVLRLRDGEVPGPLWPTGLPGLFYLQDLGPLKPTAEVLAHVSTDTPGPLPVLCLLHYGAGESLYVATDETWRWRFGRGELYFEQFWTQLIQMLARSRLQQQNRGVELELSNRRVQTDQAVVVTAKVRDAAQLQREMPRLRVAVRSADQPEGAPVETLELAAVESDPGKPADAARTYRALWRPGRAGQLRLSLLDAGGADADLTQEIEVMHPDDEMRDTAADYARLESLAAETGGQVIAPHELSKLLDLVPSRKKVIPNDIRETLWDSPLSLVLVLLLLTVEWIGRKALRLV